MTMNKDNIITGMNTLHSQIKDANKLIKKQKKLLDHMSEYLEFIDKARITSVEINQVSMSELVAQNKLLSSK